LHRLPPPPNAPPSHTCGAATLPAPCEYEAGTFVRLELASNLADSLRFVATRPPPQSGLLQRTPATLVAHPFTLVRPAGLAAFLRQRFPDLRALDEARFVAGHVTDAVSDLSTMGLVPRPAHE